MTAPSPHRNRLARETSPYLLQHAHNPVDWYPWGDEAFVRARQEDKPILLSVGYSACHWCHVMAHESFEDPATATVMNDLFVNVKVDREERPDLDRIYQSAHLLLTQRNGGWPLTLFLTPDRVPFFSGTYFPRVARSGLPGFVDLMHRIADFHRQHATDIARQNESLLAALDRLPRQTGASDRSPSSTPLQAARDQLAEAFDAELGGFGGAPKFPHPASLEHLMRSWWRSRQSGAGDEAALHMARFTLFRMCEGGLFDHLGGGFYRYSVDARFMIPHFEKMLYDNGPLLGLYAQMWAITGDPRFRDAALGTAEWVMRDMQAPSGGYHSTLDADSEGQEGRFYLWTPEQAAAHLEESEFAACARRFGLDRPPNFEGRWHLHGYATPAQLAAEFGIDGRELDLRLESARETLFRVRADRVPPDRDDKVLTAWNALMIKGMAQAALHLDQPSLADSAFRALDFIQGALWRDGRLLAVAKDGESRLNAYLDDYAFLADAVLTLCQCRWRDGDLRFAIELMDALLAHFEDRDQGGFFFTSDDHERLINRPKPMVDDALPCGNGVAGRVLLGLGHLLGNTRYLDAADRLLRWSWPSIDKAPLSHVSLLGFLETWLNPQQCVVIRGQPELARPWHRLAASPYDPNRLTLLIPNDAAPLPGLLQARGPRDQTTAYLCRGTQCSAPIQTVSDFRSALSGLA